MDNIQLQINQPRTGRRSTRSSMFKSRVARAMLAAVTIAAGAPRAATASVNAGNHELVMNGLVALGDGRADEVLAIAPVLALVVHQSATPYVGQVCTATLGMSRGRAAGASKWTASGTAGWFYYNTDPALLSLNTMYNHRVQGGRYEKSAGAWKSVPAHLEKGTVGVDSDHEFYFDFGDYDSLGHDTYYIRSTNPEDLTIPDDNLIVKWDESDYGEADHSLATVEYWLDRTHASTVLAIAEFEGFERFFIDHRTGDTIDAAGSLPTATQGSPMRGPSAKTFTTVNDQKMMIRVTNSAGLQTTSSIIIPGTASVRTTKTVRAAGGDYTTVVAAIAAASDNWDIVVEGGHTETTNEFSITNNGVRLRWDGVGVKPVLSTSAWGIKIEADDVTVYGMDPTCITADTSSNTPHGIQINGKRCAVIDCATDGDTVDHFFGYCVTPVSNGTDDDACDHCLIQGCSSERFHKYAIGGLTNHVPIMDLTVRSNDYSANNQADGPADTESTIRDLGLYYSVTYEYNKLSENSKDALRNMQGDHTTIFGNYFLEGPIRVGLSSGSEIHKSMHIRIDSNLITISALNSNGNLTFKAGNRYSKVCNNIIIRGKGGGMYSGASSPGLLTEVYAGYCECRNISTTHNTFSILAGYGNSGKPIAGFGLSNSTYVSNTEVSKNLVVHHSAYSDSVFKYGASAHVENDIVDTTLDARYEPLIAGSSVVTSPGVLYDYYGTVRGANSLTSAAVAAPQVPGMQITSGGQATNSGSTINVGDTISLHQAVSVSFTIENTGNSSLAIGQITTAGAAGIVAGSDPSNTSVPAGLSTTIVVDFDTNVAGAINGSLAIPSNDASSPFNLTFTGTVVSPAITLLDGSGPLADGNTLSLGDDITQDSAVSVSLTIQNTGTADASIGTITTTGVATIDLGSNPSNSTLAPGEAVAVVMTMDTSASGAMSGSVSVASDDPASPFVIAFLGTVLAAETLPDPNTGPQTRQEYLSVAECDGIVDQYLIGATTLKRAWASLTPADKLICIAQASIDFDSIAWIGSVVSKTQPTLWPRVDSDGDLILPGGEPIVPESVGATVWTFAGLPREIRIGVAIQAASRAASQLRLDTDSEYIGRARRGITTNAGGGLSVSVDQSVASRPSSQLHHVVYDVVAAYLPRSVGAI